MALAFSENFPRKSCRAPSTLHENQLDEQSLKILLSFLLSLSLSLPQLTWADIYLAGVLDYLNYMTKVDLLEKHENLKAVVDTVFALEPIKAWLEKRPVTDV